MQSSKTDRLLRGGIVLLSAVLVFFIYSGIHERVVVAGDSAPEFTIHADNGSTVTLPNFGGKLLVLNFWASWCPPCVEETPSLSEFQKAMKNSGVVVLAVSVDKNEKAYRDFLSRFKPAFTTALNADASVSGDYGTFKFPETYVIRDGKVVQKYIAARDWTSPELMNEIRSFL